MEKVSKSTNTGEVSLFNILKKEIFPDFEEQKVIKIGPPYDRTIPNLYYEDEADDIRVAVYLDGLLGVYMEFINRLAMDSFIRNQLEDMEIEVVSIAVSNLSDLEALNRGLKKIDLRSKI